MRSKIKIVIQSKKSSTSDPITSTLVTDITEDIDETMSKIKSFVEESVSETMPDDLSDDVEELVGLSDFKLDDEFDDALAQFEKEETHVSEAEPIPDDDDTSAVAQELGLSEIAPFDDDQETASSEVVSENEMYTPGDEESDDDDEDGFDF